jgi:hypothetical protein
MYNQKYKYKNCLICNKKPEKHNLVQCHRCHIKLHDYCYEIHSANRTYSVCPNPGCKKVGTLGQDLYFKNKYDEEDNNPEDNNREDNNSEE